MQRLLTLAALSAWALGLPTLSGCGQPVSDSQKKVQGEHDHHDHAGHDHAGHDHTGHDHAGHDHAGHDHAGHDHAAKGPHGGAILEVGEEEYHVEWLHDDDGNVDFFVLDAAMLKEVPLALGELVVTTKIGDKTEAFSLTAVTPTGDPPQSAHFNSNDPALLPRLELVGEEGASAVLTLPIKGKTYSVKIEPHRHDGHSH